MTITTKKNKKESDQIHYKNGSQEVMPKYFGIYQKALDW